MLARLFTPQYLRAEIILAVVGLMGFGFYLQLVEGLEPCPLCITQRFFLVCCGSLGLIAFLHNPGRVGTYIYSTLGVLLAGTGGFFSSRQLYLQNLPPDQAPACGPSVGFIFETFPMSEALSILMRGNGNCAEVVWTFMGLSIPAWTLVAFIGLGIGWALQSVLQQNT